MISYVKGTLTAVFLDGIIIENQGIGYDIKTPVMPDRLPKMGSQCMIYTHMYVREDAIGLYGFLTKEELDTFKLLIGVSGIGPKVALAVLSTLSVRQLKLAVLSDDTKTICKTPGIGPKGAKRLIIELKDKLEMDELEEEPMREELFQEGAEDVISLTAQALVSLGYSNSEAYRSIQAVEGRDEMDTETLLKAALKNMIF
ncbi:MAG: Holliday junction branch migration protein RuvA [Anaerostipes sp.]|uniref:Holliday junction branch migration protein RuvA n=1 Tax=Anaerostipes sp. 992a TaxID=1261637 RepID=UPI000953096B|nr:Holliday junction branch migration protein RuvA [Anaerostipes sp. 992a]MCI5951654.1 Holliday junction branch migration protein RuvA [Anaerostipes sp.]MDD5969171.1 Holliday junction branch migration protein RuvA [Anaerostipes sp.]OLR62222.1 Holliday junction DNA helicase RuvA [Anaerostipes sp. 992a]